KRFSGPPECQHRRCYPSRRWSVRRERFWLEVGRWMLSVLRLLPHSHGFAVTPCHLCTVAIVADGFDRTAFHSFLAEPFLFRRLRLFVNVRVSTIVVALEIGRRCFAAQVAV